MADKNLDSIIEALEKGEFDKTPEEIEHEKKRDAALYALDKENQERHARENAPKQGYPLKEDKAKWFESIKGQPLPKGLWKEDIDSYEKLKTTLDGIFGENADNVWAFLEGTYKIGGRK